MTKTQPAAEIMSLAAQLSGWSPGSIELTDPLDPGPAQSLNDLLADGPAPYRGGPVDPLYHWVYFHTWPPRTSLAPDGHPRTGEFMPPLRDRRRMFAGGRCTFHTPLYFSEQTAATSSLANCKLKRGRNRLHQPVFASETVDAAVIDSVASAASDGLARAPVEGPDAPTRVAIIDPAGELRASATAGFRHAAGQP